MQDYNLNDAEDTLSLSNLCMEDDSEQVSNPNHSSMSSSSSSSSSLSEQDFVGFFNEEWGKINNNASSENNIVFCGKVFDQPISISRDDRKKNPLFRSNSDSFRFVRSKIRPTRSKSLPNRYRSSSACKSRLMMFMFGSGSTKFPTMVDMNDIKSRQLRQQSTINEESTSSSGGRNKRRWRLVDVLGCGGGRIRAERDMTVGVI